MYSAFNSLKHEVISNFINIKTNKDLEFSYLVDFHSKNKYLYFCYDINIKNKLGKLVSNSEDKNVSEIFDEYYNLLEILFSSNLSKGKIINSMYHMYGYFKDKINREDFKNFEDKVI